MRRFVPPTADKSGFKPELHIFEDKKRLASAAAAFFSAATAGAVSARGKFLVALSGGSTPQALFTLLAHSPFQAQILWPAVHVFWGDERLVPADDPDSNYFHARRLLLQKVPIPSEQIHRIRGELTADKAVEDYEDQLVKMAEDRAAWPRFDLALMGMGMDGHTASLFPNSSAVTEKTKPVLSVTANYAGRPAERITLTPPVFIDARQVLFLVAGADKAKALEAVINGPLEIQKWPAQSIQPISQNLTYFVDRAAASHLKAS
jgi:6-phosphogluconolactonase